jgi:hypothetical protein
MRERREYPARYLWAKVRKTPRKRPVHCDGCECEIRHDEARLELATCTIEDRVSLGYTTLCSDCTRSYFRWLNRMKRKQLAARAVARGSHP